VEAVRSSWKQSGSMLKKTILKAYDLGVAASRWNKIWLLSCVEAEAVNFCARTFMKEAGSGIEFRSIRLFEELEAK